MKKILLVLLAFHTIFLTCRSQIIKIPIDYPTIQQGVNASSNGDTILVLNGVYTENLEIANKGIVLTSNYLFSNDSSDIYNTVIDGDFKTATVVIENVYSLNMQFCGFTIQNGEKEYGGGLIIFKGDPLIKNMIIRNNIAKTGAGVYIFGAKPVISESIIEGNSALYGAGGVYCYQAEPLLENVIIRYNTADSGSGGGIFCYKDGNIVLRNVKITNNYSYYRGGGIASSSSYVTIINSLLAGNVSTFYGGGIFETHDVYAESNGLDIINSTITNNTAQSGGGIDSFFGWPKLINCIVWGNIPNEMQGMPWVIQYTNMYPVQAGNGNFYSDPVFVSSGDNPYSINDYSPCIDAGTPDTSGLHLPEYDLAGNIRVENQRIDIGTYEWNMFVDIADQSSDNTGELFEVYPVPAHGFLNLKFKENIPKPILIELIDLNGNILEILFEGSCKSGVNIIHCKLSSFPTGNYLIRLSGANSFKTKKIQIF